MSNNIYKKVNIFIEDVKSGKIVLESNEWLPMNDIRLHNKESEETGFSIDEYRINTVGGKLSFLFLAVCEETYEGKHMLFTCSIPNTITMKIYPNPNEAWTTKTSLPMDLAEEEFFQESLVIDMDGMSFETYRELCNFFNKEVSEYVLAN